MAQPHSPGDLVVLPSGVPALVVAVDTRWDETDDWGDGVRISRTVYSLMVDGALQEGIELPHTARALPRTP